MSVATTTVAGIALAATLAVGAPAIAAERALVIGLDVYQDTRLNAKSGTPALNGVNAMKLMLATRLKFTPDNIKTLTNDQATRQGILAAIQDWLVAGSKPGERVFLYFTGHGYFAKDQNGDEADGLDEGFVPFDAKPAFEGGKLTISGLLIDDELASALAALKGRKVTVVADAGFSGRVTRGAGAASSLQLTPNISQATRSIAVEPRVAKQKAEGGWFDGVPGVSVAVWSAVSASQTALLDAGDPTRIGGVFTRFFIEGAGEGRADRNGNGKISNAELLQYVTAASKAYCDQHKAACEFGLTPRLDPAAAVALTVLPEATAGSAQPSTQPLTTATTEPAGGTVTVPGKLTTDTITDFLAKGNADGISLRQIPEGIVHVGQGDIRFQVISPHDGFLILLNLTDAGELIQLYPNQFSRKRDREGRVRAGAPLTVPDDYYGIRFRADAPSTGRVIAIVTRRKVDWDAAVATRAIEIIPRKQALEEVLPKISAALNKPIASADPAVNTAPVPWSVATMRYVIK